MLPSADSIVLFPSGAVTGDATVLHVEGLGDGRTVVLLDRTPAHPVDAGWPDQGPDRGALRWAGGDAQLDDVVVAAVGPADSPAMHLGADVPVRKGAEGWAFVVAHVLAPGAAAPEEGDAVEVAIDAEHRRALSSGHSACHLASLALNAALEPAWRKPPRPDALGRPDFDGTAIVTSTIGPDGSVDVYRVGKSVRKAGFEVAALDDLAAVEAAVQARLDAWLAAGGAIRMDADGERLTDRRRWVAATADGEASIPCGGTHVDGIDRFSALRVRLERADADGGIAVTMTTAATPS